MSCGIPVLLLILVVPYVVGNELLKLVTPGVGEQAFTAHALDGVHKSVHILDQDVVASYQHLLLLLLFRASWLLIFGSGVLGQGLQLLARELLRRVTA